LNTRVRHTLVATTVAIALCCSSFAADAGKGQQVAPAQVYSKILSNMQKEIVSAAEAMPAEKYDFAPSSAKGSFDGVRTFAQQVKHLAAANYEFFGRLGVAPDIDPKTIDQLTSKEDIIKALNVSYTFAQRAINTITPENAFTALDARQNTRAGLATQGLAHANDHYGQMVEYLRMNGIVPPASRK
jgi:uncharacterized damage-inducible protein DinB